MDIHEYQAKDILTRYGLNAPSGGLAYTPEQASYRASELGGEAWVVKAQVHTGGRGLAGGIQICDCIEKVAEAADTLLGKRLNTRQTGTQGKLCHRLYVETACHIEREYYLALVLDRAIEQVVMVASREGGMAVEQLAEGNPESLIKIAIEPAGGMQPFQAREMAFALGLPPSQLQQAVAAFLGCYRAMCALDATLIEINPLALTRDGRLLALDAKMSFDDNALYRHPDVSELRDKSQENELEMRAADRGLSYVGLEGHIGCIINGAGLAMATMDMIKQAGGEPANFLDIGGGASPERTAKAFKLVLSDARVEAVLVNIFAGINRCDWIAEGVLQAVRQLKPDIPLVIRLSGTNVVSGKQMIQDSQLAICTVDTLLEASQQVVAAWRQATGR